MESTPLHEKHSLGFASSCSLVASRRITGHSPVHHCPAHQCLQDRGLTDLCGFRVHRGCTDLLGATLRGFPGRRSQDSTCFTLQTQPASFTNGGKQAVALKPDRMRHTHTHAHTKTSKPGPTSGEKPLEVSQLQLQLQRNYGQAYTSYFCGSCDSSAHFLTTWGRDVPNLANRGCTCLPVLISEAHPEKTS